MWLSLSVTNGTVSGFSGSGTNYIFTVTPTNDGPVKVNVPPGIATDAAGNNNTAATALIRNFDSIEPTSISFSPADDATNTAVDANLEVVFDEAIQKGSGNIVIKKISDNSVVETLAVTDSNITVDWDSLSINPASNLVPNNYYVEIANGAIQDYAGNKYAGITGATTWNFTTNINQAPIITSGNTVSYPENAIAIVYDAKATDPDGDTTLTYSLSGKDADLFDIITPYYDKTTGSISFKTVPNYESPADSERDNIYDIIVNVSDGNLSASQAVAITVTNVNEPPALTGIPPTLSNGTEDTPYTLAVSNLVQGFSDVEGDPLIVSNLTATNGSLTNNNKGTYTFTPTANYNGVVNLSYNVTDGQGGSVDTSQRFNVTAVNDIPVVTDSSSLSLTSGTISPLPSSVFTDRYTDVETPNLVKIKITSLPTNGVLALNNTAITLNQEILAANLGQLSYEPSAKFSGSDNFTWQGSDGTDYSRSATVSFNVSTSLKSSAGLVIDGYISNTTVFFDTNLNGVQDESEPFAQTEADGSFNLTLNLEKFDTNQNTKIDSSEGKLITSGGIDISTNLPLDTPLSATPDSTVITPLTTIVAQLAQAGIDPEAAKTQVKSALGLPSDIDLATFDPLEAIREGDAKGVSVFGSMIMVQNTIVQSAKFIDGISKTALAQLSHSGITAIANQLKAGTPVDLSKPEIIQNILLGAIAEAAKSDPSINPSNLTNSAAAAAQVMALGNQMVKELVASGRPIKDIALEITKLQAVSVGQIAVGLPELAAGTVSVEEFLANNTKEAILARMEKVQVNDPTVRPVVEDNPIDPTEPTDPTDSNDPGTPTFPIPTTDSSSEDAENAEDTADDDCNCPPTPPLPSVNFDVAITHTGTPGDDAIAGTPKAEGIKGSRGHDMAMGMSGNDTLIGGNGITSENNSNDADELFGNAGSDLITGNESSDTLHGGKDGDLLFGGKDDDLIHGDMGSDTLSGDMGSDTVCGDSEQDLIYGQSGDDVLYGNTGNDSLSGGDGKDTIYGGKNNDLLHGDAGNDLLVGDAGNDSLCAGDGDDTVVGGLGHSTGVGSNGEQDTLCGGAGNDLMSGNEGQDSIDGGTGNDTLFGGKDNDIVIGDAGADIVSGNKGSDNLDGGTENDALYGNQEDDTLDGGTGNDSLNGGQQNDILTGNEGDDWLAGDKGNDTLTGDVGRDRFILTPTSGSDLIADFEDGVDSLVLAGGITFEKLTITSVEGGSAIALASSGELLATLNGIQSNLIGVDDFTLSQNLSAIGA